MAGKRVVERNMFYGASTKIFEAASILRRNMTLPELILWKKLKNRAIFKFKFRRQHPVDIFIVDFYCHELKLAIEVDGEIHNNETAEEYDLGRTAELEKYGITLLRFTNAQVLFDIVSVKSTILKQIHVLSRRT